MSERTVKIASIGSALQDVFLLDQEDFTTSCDEEKKMCVFNRLTLGTKIDIDRINFSVGGGATNVAVTFARQGLAAVFLGTVGHDPAGQAVLAKLDEEGVDTSFVKYSRKYNTGYSVLLLAPNGERTIMTYRGASNRYDLIEVDNLDKIKPDWLYASTLSGDMVKLAEVFAKCRKLGIKIMFNPGKYELEEPAKLKALLEDVEVLILNKEETMQLVSGSTMEELLAHALNLVKCMIVTDGQDGVLASDGKVKVRAGIYEDVKAVDRTGAGDAFGSGFLSQYVMGKSLKESIIFASANSTSVVAHIDAKTGILRKGVELHAMPIHEEKM